MDIRSRYLNLINMLMFILGVGLAVFVVTAWSTADEHDRREGMEQNDPPQVGMHQSRSSTVIPADERTRLFTLRQPHDFMTPGPNDEMSR